MEPATGRKSRPLGLPVETGWLRPPRRLSADGIDPHAALSSQQVLEHRESR
jgi:hypothetical protein